MIACTGAVMLLHINPTGEKPGCAYCAFLYLGAAAVSGLVGGFFGFLLVEQITQESAAVLEEIGQSITSEVLASKCWYGKQAS